MKRNANGVELFYQKSGSGAPLLLLHGNGEDHHIFDRLGAKLNRHFTIYAIDSRNHGQSAKTKTYSYETMSEDVYALMQELHLKKTNLIGFSDGAAVGLLLAMRHADALEKMALLGVNLKPEDFTADNYQHLSAAYEKTKDPLIHLMLEQPRIELSEVRAVSCEALIVAAENDVFRPETFTKLADALPRARLKLMAGHDHDSYIVNQDILYEEFVQFFKA